jgi:type IV pilus assembly protein PilY1
MNALAQAALLSLLVLWHAACLAAGTTPALVVPDGQLGLAGSRVHPNLLINLSLTFADAGAAYRDSYDRAVEYAGYFNPRMCYSYPMKRRSPTELEPDLDERSGYFSVHKPADALRECGADSFSGNFLNWSSASTLDLLRYALTGGDRVIDEPGLTVLQRAWLPDGVSHPDFYANAAHFPRKSVAAGGSGSAPGKVTPFEADSLYVVSCRNRILFSNTDKGSQCDAPRHGADGARLASDKYFGEFNARVQVCAGADDVGRPGLCRRYESGFKPEGSVQQHSAKLRIGLMSYLTEQGANDPDLYGGVLRAPLKFVGATTYDAPLFAPAANGQSEWNAGSGVLAANPDQSAGAASGAINYINQLGRSQPGRFGSYKTADPGAELYYESLRYLQGREPSTRGGGASDAGFPVWASRSDPVTAACQRNAVATVGHSSFVEDRYLPGNTRADRRDIARSADGFVSSASFDVMQSSRSVGAMEADTAGTYANPAPRADLLGLDGLDDGPAGAGSYYLAGAAYWAHTHAIRTDKPVHIDSYSLELDQAPRPGSSALYLAAKYGGFEDRNGDANPFITSASRAGESEWSMDGSTPATFFSASNPHDLIASVRALFAGAGAARGRLPGAAVIARQGAGGYVLQASYEQSGWSGSLQRLPLSVSAGGVVELGSAPLWDAAELLDGNHRRTPPVPPKPLPSARKIYTLVRNPDLSTITVPFQWDSLGRDEQAYLDLAPSSAMRDGLGAARTAFLRGDRTRETGQREGVFRRRTSVLGDSIHSVPLLVGAPSAGVQGAGYDGFYARYKSRRSVIYLGANDGMLHAFDAADGSELFAYVPNALVPALNQLSSPAYQHRAYVDGSAAHGEASINGSWRTVLVSGMGMGARGVFALDITDASAFEAGMGALWEFTGNDDPAMGHVSAPPQIAKLKTGMNGNVPTYRYFAIVASGINNYGPDADRPDASGALFLLALDKPAAAAWRLGVNYYRLATPVSEPALANALAAPALAIGADGSARFAYAGDLQGNLWRFDFTGRPPWSDAVGPGSGGQPLFVARDAAGQRQPIMHAPKLVFAPGGGYVVLFGTGKFIEEADLQPAGFAPQSFYAVHDSVASPAVVVRGRGELAPRTLSGGGSYAIKGAEFSFSGPGSKKGWYFDFPNARGDGERVAGSAVIAAGAIVITSLVPGTDACAAPASRSYVVDTLSGFAFNASGVAVSEAASGELTQGAPAASPMLFELSTSVGLRSATGRASAARTLAVVRMRGEGAPPSVQPVKVILPAKRLSWREVANWQELHDATKK